MSHHTLERIFVRMLYDRAFVDRVYANPELALAGLELDDAERANLVAVDRRAWGHDPLRRYRTLRTLSEEYKASTTLLLASTRSLASLDAFFSSREFHDAVQRRGSLALAFGAFVARLMTDLADESGQLADVLGLETMLARCRRAEPNDVELDREASLDADAMLGLAPGHAVGSFNANVVEAINAAERYLFEVGLMPAVALCDDAPRLDALPPVVEERAYLLAMPGASGVTLMPLDADYFALLDAFTDGPLPVATARERAAARGLSAEDCDTMLGSLVEERVLVDVR